MNREIEFFYSIYSIDPKKSNVILHQPTLRMRSYKGFSEVYFHIFMLGAQFFALFCMRESSILCRVGEILQRTFSSSSHNMSIISIIKYIIYLNFGEKIFHLQCKIVLHHAKVQIQISNFSEIWDWQGRAWGGLYFRSYCY